MQEKLLNIGSVIKRFVRFYKFIGVGVSSLVIQFSLFNILILFTSIQPGMCNIIADQIPILTSFLLNNHFTHNDNKIHLPKKLLAAFIKYYLIVILATIIQSIIIQLGTDIFGETILLSNLLLAFGLAITTVLNYQMQKRFIWYKKDLTSKIN
jgi:putative flippase GtrA